MAKEVNLKEQASIQARLIAFVSLAVTVGFWSQGTDPFNLPKLIILVAGVAALLASNAMSLPKLRVSLKVKVEHIAIILFILALLNSFLFSGAPKLQMFFGTFARNTGMLTHLSLVGIFYFALHLQRRADFERILK